MTCMYYVFDDNILLVEVYTTHLLRNSMYDKFKIGKTT